LQLCAFALNPFASPSEKNHLTTRPFIPTVR
jgi:hypothetical protein